MASKEQGISDARRGTQGQAAARGRAGHRVGAPVTAEMVAESPGGGKDFGSKVRDQGKVAGSGKSWEQKRTTNCEKQSVGCLSNARA